MLWRTAHPCIVQCLGACMEGGVAWLEGARPDMLGSTRAPKSLRSLRFTSTTAWPASIRFCLHGAPCR
jgi:hypothetical protein